MFEKIMAQLRASMNNLAQQFTKTREAKIKEVQQQQQTNNQTTTTTTNPSPSNNTPPPPNQNNTDTNNSNETKSTNNPNTLNGSVGKDGKNEKDDVIKVQTRLNAHGASLKIDGDCGPKTISTIEAFQRAKFNSADGRVDPGGRTWNALLAPRSNQQNNTNTNNNQQPPNNANNNNNNSQQNNTNNQNEPWNDTSNQPQGKETWDRHTNSRVQSLQPAVKNAALNFVNEVQQSLNLKLRVTSAYRSIEEQDALFKQGGVTKARGGQSYHNYGLAIDVCIISADGKNADFNITNPIANIGKKLGFAWGGDWKGFVDKPHFEMTFGKSVRDLCIAKYPQRAKELGYLSGNTPPNTTTPTTPTTPSNPNTLSGSVGKDGKNEKDDVIKVQTRLNAHGASLSTDGNCGPKTIAAIEAFQRAKFNSADGRVDAGGRTWNALLAQPNNETSPANNNNNPNQNNNNTGLEDLAKKYNLEVAVILAIQKVESGGNGYLSDGRPKILFEGHIFWKQLQAVGIDPNSKVKGNEDILYPKWDKSKYKGGAAEYPRLEKAIKIHRQAALKSASWGEYQIMGFNHKAAGYPDVESFVQAIQQGQGSSNNINALLGFLQTNKLLVHVQGNSKNWAAFAKGYNGPGYAQNKYDTKLAAAYEEFKKKGH